MSVDEILTKIRRNGANGGYKTNNVIFRAQSGHGTLREEQRPGVPYDFRHHILIHKTKVPLWRSMSRSNDPFVRCQGRDIHLVPVQFLFTEPDMLRQYGGRVLLFNMNSQATKDALRTARETNNGYILVSEDIPLDTLEAVFDLDNDNWDFPYTPETQAQHLVSSQGLDDASHLLHYYSKVEHQQTVSFDDLPILHRQTVMDIGDHYLKHLRYPGGPPADARAGTTAANERSSAVRDDAIHRVVTEVFEKAEQQKQRIEAKGMERTSQFQHNHLQIQDRSRDLLLSYWNKERRMRRRPSTNLRQKD